MCSHGWHPPGRGWVLIMKTGTCNHLIPLPCLVMNGATGPGGSPRRLIDFDVYIERVRSTSATSHWRALIDWAPCAGTGSSGGREANLAAVTPQRLIKITTEIEQLAHWWSGEGWQPGDKAGAKAFARVADCSLQRIRWPSLISARASGADSSAAAAFSRPWTAPMGGAGWRWEFPPTDGGVAVNGASSGWCRSLPSDLRENTIAPT